MWIQKENIRAIKMAQLLKISAEKGNILSLIPGSHSLKEKLYCDIQATQKSNHTGLERVGKVTQRNPVGKKHNLKDR